MSQSSKQTSSLSAELVWHYTSPDGLAGMVTENVVRATSAAFMNDAHELVSGARALKKHFDREQGSLSSDVVEEVRSQVLKRTRDNHSSYILSGSVDKNSLTLWRNYGKHTISYAVGFDPSVPLLPLQVTDEEEHPDPPPGWGPQYDEDDEGRRFLVVDPDQPVAECLSYGDRQWVPVVYAGKRRKKIVESIYNDIVKRAMNPKPNSIFLSFDWLSDLLLIKSKGFKDEHEVRICYTLLSPDWKFLSYRSTALGVTPYIELTRAPLNYDRRNDLTGGGRDYAQAAAKLPIAEVRIGPTSHRRAAKKALRQLLDQRGYGHVRISSSKIPYR